MYEQDINTTKEINKYYWMFIDIVVDVRYSCLTFNRQKRNLKKVWLFRSLAFFSNKRELKLSF